MKATYRRQVSAWHQGLGIGVMLPDHVAKDMEAYRVSGKAFPVKSIGETISCVMGAGYSVTHPPTKARSTKVYREKSAAGLIRVETWVKKEDVEALKAHIRKFTERGCQNGQ